MIKISVSYSRKVPTAEAYSNVSYFSSLERELSDGLTASELQQEYNRSYVLLEQIVDSEVEKHKGQLAASNVPVARQTQVTQQSPQAPQGNYSGPSLPGSTAAISQKQISLICSLASQLNISQHDLCNEALRHYGKASYHELTKSEGSAFIKLLQARKQPA